MRRKVDLRSFLMSETREKIHIPIFQVKIAVYRMNFFTRIKGKQELRNFLHHVNNILHILVL